MSLLNVLISIFGTSKPIIGMVHLKPLPGSPLYDRKGGMEKIAELALRDADALIAGGVDGIQIENQWDRPFSRERDMGPETVASVTHVATLLRQRTDVPLGVCIHLNAVVSAIAVAAVTGCQWVRAFEIANAYVSNAGIIEAAGPQAIRYRTTLDAQDRVRVFADFHVKHGSHQMTADRAITEQLEDVQIAGADAAIVTGLKTGVAPSARSLKELRGVVSIPLILGSGLTLENADELLPLVDGAIAGTYFKEKGVLENPVDSDRVRRFMDRVKKLRGDQG
ncbi:MAG: BtpA/SgcQ family protein [Spirochaetia bacterium]|jgi:membrane complex biogenesis BtpA family protein